MTMKDVAKEAGVSVATVSNYLNNTKSVSASRGEKIAEAIEKLHYVPNQMAKTLKSNFNNNIGVILPNIQDNYYIQIFQGIERFFHKKGYCVNLGISNDFIEIEQKNIFDFLQKKVAGFIIVTAQPDNCAFFEENILEKHIPFVHIDRQIDITNLNFLTFDNQNTLYKLTDYFLQSGKTNITLIAGPQNFSCESEAVSGYRRAFQSHHIPVNEKNILHTTLSKEAAFRSSILYLQTEKPDVMITTSTLVTLGVLESLSIIGYKVPEDVIVATLGEDNWNRFNHFQNIVSTSRQAILLGGEAAKTLHSQIETPKVFEPQNRILEDKYEASHFLIQHTPRCDSYRKELSIMMLDTLQVDLFIGLIPHFKNKSGIDIKVTKVPHQQLLQNIYQDTNTDLYMYDLPWLYSLAKDNILADITNYINQDNVQKNIYLKDCLDIFGKFEQKYYGLPFMYAPQILFYRKDIFQNRQMRNEFYKRYNIKLQPPRSWKEFNIISEFFTQSLNPSSPTRYGTAIPAAYEECLIPEIYMRMRAYGSEIYNQKFKIVFNSQQTIKAYTNFKELLENSSPDYMKLNDMMVVDEFLNGNTAMLITYPSFISNINDLQRSCQVGQVGFSHIPGKCPILGGWNLGVSNHSDNKDEAFAFIHWACGEEMANYSTIMAGQSAIAKVFDNNELISLYPWLPLYKNVYDFAEPIIPPYMSKRDIISQDKIDKILYKWISEMISDNISIEDSVCNTHLDLVELFNSYGYRQ